MRPWSAAGGKDGSWAGLAPSNGARPFRAHAASRGSGVLGRLRVAATQGGSPDVRMKDPSGEAVRWQKESITVGSSPTADLRIEADKVSPEHAQLEIVNGRVMCTALVGDEEDLFSKSYTWMDGTELRKGVQYMVPPGASLAFGDEAAAYRLDFEEKGGTSPLVHGMMKMMASQCGEEAQSMLDQSGL